MRTLIFMLTLLIYAGVIVTTYMFVQWLGHSIFVDAVMDTLVELLIIGVGTYVTWLVIPKLFWRWSKGLATRLSHKRYMRRIYKQERSKR